MRQMRMTSIANEVELALRVGYENVEKEPSSEFVPCLQTERTIVFNSRFWDLLINENKENHRHLGEIRRKEPSLFHQLLGTYYGDLKMKDRIYKLRSDDSAYSLQAVILSPEIPAKHFYRKRHKLCDILCSHKPSEFYRSTSMGHVEKVLDQFHDNHPLAFKKTRFLYNVHFKDTNVVTYPLKEYVLFGNGYAVTQSSSTFQIPQEKREYQGPFIHLILRGPKSRKDYHLGILRELFEVLEN